MAEQPMRHILSGDWLFSRLPGWVLDTLTTEQKEAIHAAADEGQWQSHPVNIRLTVPVIRRRYFLTIVGGEEKRSLERRAHDRHRYPLRTVANVLFFLGAAAIVYVGAILVIALQSSIVEF
ncbi:MAG: hypothetical protein QGG84_05795, partial [Rhodospirillales bacterium]|nr:hypothetical protein [Rhodospirillales bacterium]